MKPSELRLICRCAQWIDRDMRHRVPQRVRGIYALLHKKQDKYNVVYIGLANAKRGIRARLNSHARNKRKRDKWTHFSFFEVWPNITHNEIQELEGLFREIYRKDANANSLLVQTKYKRLQKVRKDTALKRGKLKELEIVE